MLNQSGVTKSVGYNTRQILLNVDLQASLGIVVSEDAGVEVGTRKIVKAGTPVTGDLDARTTAFTAATTSEEVNNAVGVLLHDVDVTKGDANATLLIFGFVNKNRLDESVKSLLTADVVKALDKKITFVSA